MAMILCPSRKHYYNDAEHTACPYCGVRLSRAIVPEHTVTQKQQAVFSAPCADDDAVTQAKPRHPFTGEDEATVSLRRAQEDGKTIGIYRSKRSGSPVSGWLVCTAGEDYGRDYRIFSGYNRVGSHPSLEICISDAELAPTGHFTIAYDPRSNQFFLIPLAGNLTRINGSTAQKSVALKAYDEIEAGRSKLVFIPFCKGDTRWEIT